MNQLRFRFQSNALLTMLLGILFNNAATAEEVNFSRDVLPLLSDRCFHCHGPDENHREADLRLDEKEAVFQDRDGHAAVVAGNLDESELFRRITSDDEDEKMPPPDSNRKPLTQQEIKTIEKWIASGAEWGKHWSFEKPERRTPPTTKLSKNDHPIDAFVQRRLEDFGLQPSPKAAKHTLIRRVTLDLTGLPPTVAEVDAFLQDNSTDAYEKVVDRLLQSTHYGERMAWPWLDAARYADTGGYQGDPERTMWPWRDWVIHAINNNMPFDQFTIEQLAGDLLPNATPEQRLATGFNRNHMHNSEGGRIAEETRIENVFDRAETTGTVWLGLTLQCARCHDHKFDPTSNQDYFAFFDFFNQTTEDGRTDRSNAIPPNMNYIPLAGRTKLKELDEQIEQLKKQLTRPDAKVDAAQSAWESTWLQNDAKQWQPIDASTATSAEGATITKRDDLALHVTGKLPEKDVYQISAITKQTGLSSFRLDALVDPESAAQGTGRDEQGNFFLSEIELYVRPTGKTDQGFEKIRFVKAEADYAQGGHTINKAVDGKTGGDEGWSVNGHKVKKPRWAKLTTDKPIGFEGGTELKFKLYFNSKHTHHSLALFRLSSSKQQQTAEKIDSNIAQLLRKPARSAADTATIKALYRRQLAKPFAEIATQLSMVEKQRASVAEKVRGTRVMVMDTCAKPRATKILVKGQYNDVTDKKVTANVPSMLPRLNGLQRRANRLDLAKWIVSPNNPLTARVTVNRFWQTFFGAGLVATPGDFGLQGSRPTHPDLLDWLAIELIESNWNVKHLHKLIVTSSTYRQSARVTPELLKVDPANKWLARFPRRRMPSWMLRDQALAFSGLLAAKLGGPPVKPYQPAGVWAEATFGKTKYQPDSGDRLYRRSIYTFWRRIVGPTMFFDAAKRQTCEVKPNLTNTPLHALTTLNDVTYIETARVLAERIIKQHDTVEDRLQSVFRILVARAAESKEVDLLTRRIKTCIEQFKQAPDNARRLLQVGASPRDQSLDAVEHAAYTAVFNTLMNLDEVLVRP